MRQNIVMPDTSLHTNTTNSNVTKQKNCECFQGDENLKPGNNLNVNFSPAFEDASANASAEAANAGGEV